MSLSRLLTPTRLRPWINSVECRRWYSSVNDRCDISQPLKKLEVAEQKKAMAVEILETKYVTEDERVFPKETHAKKEVGTWNNLVGLIQRTKKKFLRDHMEQKSCSTCALTSTSDLKDSDNVVSADNHDSGTVDSLKIAIHSEKTSVASIEENVGSETSQPSYAGTSEPMEVVKMKNAAKSAGPEEILNVSSKECEVSVDHGVNGISSGISSIYGKDNSKDTVQLVDVYHSSELVGKEREPFLAEEVLSSVQISSGGEILSKSEEACILGHQMQVEIPRTLHEVSANKSNSTSPENQQDNIACEFLSNLKFEKTDTSDTSCGTGSIARLQDVSQEKQNNEPYLEAKNDQIQRGEVVSEILSVFEKNGKSNLEQGAHSNSLLLSEATHNWQDVLVKESVFSANENRPAEDISKSIVLSNSKMDEISSVSKRSFQMMRLGDRHIGADHRAVDQILNPKSEKSVAGEFEPLNGTSQNTFVNSGDIKCLIECIRELPTLEPSVISPEEKIGRSVDRNREVGANSGLRAQTDVQSSDRKKRKTSSQGLVGKKENNSLSNMFLEDLNTGDKKTEIGDIVPHDCSKSIETKETASLRGKIDLNKGENASLSEKLSDENKVTLKFVTLSAKESDVSNAFKDCGAITKVVFQSVKSAKFKVAHIYFKSEEGRQKALGKSDVIVRERVALESTSPKGREGTCIPDLIGHPEVPTSLVKHPSRTVMIKDLKHNVSFHDIEEAIAYCRSNITGIFFGSSSSVAYVEFETVEDKEIALEKRNLIVVGDRLPILRIDAPRTTVIRITNINALSVRKVYSVCRSVGMIRQFLLRSYDMVDAHYKFTEWPRMLEILNRLNEVKVDGRHIVAKPATVYPPDVLDVLWSQPEGRRHLKTEFKRMLLKLGENGAGTVGITEVLDDFYADAPER